MSHLPFDFHAALVRESEDMQQTIQDLRALFGMLRSIATTMPANAPEGLSVVLSFMARLGLDHCHTLVNEAQAVRLASEALTASACRSDADREVQS
jgi:hypothetical protein